MKKLFFFALFCASFVLPTSGADDRLGFAIGEPHADLSHSGSQPAYNQAATTGAGWIRHDIPWSTIETSQGVVYNLDPEKLNWLQLSCAAGLKVCVVVEAGNTTFSAAPFSPTWYADPWDPTGYSKACAALVQQYPTLVGAIEVLNEPNNDMKAAKGATWRDALVTLTNTTADAVTAVNPNITTIGFGVQGAHILYCLSKPLSPNLKGVVVHPYDAGSNFPEQTYEPPDTDHETWLGHLKAATTLPIWETEFNSDNGSDGYLQKDWLMRRLLMSLHGGVAHWMPFGWVFNACNTQQQVDWNGLDPRLFYYSIQELFGPNELFIGAQPIAALPTFTSSDPTFTAANAKGYVFQSSAYTLCGIWYGGAAPSYLGKKDSVVTVQFHTPLTNVSGSYVLNMVSRTATNINVTVSSGVATVSGVDLSTEANLIVLAPGSTPTPTPTATPTPTPGIQPSIALPSNYTLKWNQDFTAPAYKPFNVPSIVSTSGPPGSIWRAYNTSAQPAIRKYDGTNGDPFTTDNGYLNIHANGTPATGSAYGGDIESCAVNTNITGVAGEFDDQSPGFHAAVAYWEGKIRMPAGGSAQWPAFWIRGSDLALNKFTEVDIMEFGYQIPGSTNGSFQINLHSGTATKGLGNQPAGYVVNPPMAVMPGGWHIFGCWVQLNVVSIYLDGALVHTFNLDPSLSFGAIPMAVLLENVFGPGYPATGATGDLGCQYIRCWTPQ